ncbi:hypothetical protein IHO40_01730 [Wolbachia endosymbiont of Mansonella ozzardi]|uniref:hypothetical protein n=1 Tax=Wolbachia endosymbiont of Mansonella ozzardi TaxID=137464 RepID=UPI001CE1CFC1|nr:hypothetical protein [Wolbachia endosymbiont of Mansonella ozzardi]MCA4774875.1 hypothetical protein [Wolbachia endosymbiont of Mansonella ozzardi]
MMSLFYGLRLLSYILGNLKDIVVKLFLIIIYLYASSVTFMFLSNGFWYAVEFGSFKNAFNHLFECCKWYYDNKDDLNYGVYFRILVAFLAPHFLYRLLLSAGWKSFLKERITQILRFMIKGKRSSKANGSGYNYSSKNSYSSSNHYGYNDERHAQERRKVAVIRQLLVKDIEETIDKRLNDIFFGERSKSH